MAQASQASLGCCGLGLAIRCHSSLLAPDAFPATPFPPQRTGAALSWKHLCPTDARQPTNQPARQTSRVSHPWPDPERHCCLKFDGNLVLGRSGRCCHSSPHLCCTFVCPRRRVPDTGTGRASRAIALTRLCGTDDRHTAPGSASSTKQSPILIHLPTGRARTTISLSSCERLVPLRDSPAERFNCLLRTLLPRASTATAAAAAASAHKTGPTCLPSVPFFALAS